MVWVFGISNVRCMLLSALVLRLWGFDVRLRDLSACYRVCLVGLVCIVR